MLLFFVLLVVTFLVRLQRFDFPLSYTFAWGDGTRDFLVANHILRYQEFVLVGPFNLFNEAGVRNSPLYFYLLSLFLLPFNNILTLSFFNILLQLGITVLIFYITKRLFDLPTALIAIVLFSFNPEVIKQADFVWQPFMMLPLALLGLLFLVNSYKLLSLAAISIAISLHNSAVCWLPPFFIYMKKTLKFYPKAFLVIFLSVFFSYLPLIFFYLKSGFSKSATNISIYANSPSAYFINLGLNIDELLKAFYINKPLAILLVIGFFIILKRDWKNRKVLIFFLLLFVSPIIFASFFNKIRLHYLILSLSLLPILVSYITSIFKPFLRTLIVLILIIIFTGNSAYSKEIKNPLDNQKKVEIITSKVKEQLDVVKQAKGFSDYSFFQIESFALSDIILPYPVLDTFLIVALEDKLNIKLSQNSDQSPYNHVQLNKKDFLLISCFKFNKSKKDCIQFFKTKHQDINIYKMIYNDESISIYIAHHE